MNHATLKREIEKRYTDCETLSLEYPDNADKDFIHIIGTAHHADDDILIAFDESDSATRVKLYINEKDCDVLCSDALSAIENHLGTYPDIVHPFEQSGLGKAPFEFLGVTRNVGPIKLADGITSVGSPGQPMGSCKHCGTGIAYEYRIRSACGKVSTVGSTCIEKIYKKAKYHSDKILKSVRDAALAERRRIRKENEEKKLAEFKEFTNTHSYCLRGMGETLEKTAWSQVIWFNKNAGVSGKLRLFKELRERIDAMSADEYNNNVELGMQRVKEALELKEKMEKQAEEESKKGIVDQTWIIEALKDADKGRGEFIPSIIRQISTPSTHALSDRLSDRQLYILRDIYAKTRGGRRNSKKYIEAVEVFDKKMVEKCVINN